MKEIVELIRKYRSLPPKKWDKELPALRKQLKQVGFYKLPLNERESILNQSK